MDFNAQQIETLDNRIQQLKQLMNQQRNFVPPTAAVAPQKPTYTIPEVDGLDGARQFLQSMGPSSSAAVFDKGDSAFYGLSVDANGNPGPIKVGRYTLEDAPEPGSDNITKADLEAFKAEIRSALAGLITPKEDKAE